MDGEVAKVLGSYTLGERLHDGKAHVVHRAEDARSGRRVIVKQLRGDAAGAEELRRMRHERDLLAELHDPAVAQLLDYHERGLDAWLVIEDIGGESLARRLARGRLPLRDTIHVAAAVAGALGAVHARHIVHKDVGPNNVAIASNGRVQLFDFDLAARLPRGAAGLPPAGHLEGTLPYVSPEQTGRMSSPVDERSDLYSLGAMLYEIVTGRPPFRSDDALELVHAHLALRPAPPHEVDPAVPEVVSAIVLKLLEKSPADRYQSAFGALQDLRACLDALDAEGTIRPFPIGRRDVPSRLHLSGRLYGRRAETEELVGAFEACREGRPSFIVVAGPPGIGKSALCRTFARHVASARGLIGAGKLEAERPEAPHAALVEPLRALAQQIFAAGDDEVAALSARVAQAAPGGGGLLAELVPELAAVLGERPHERGDAASPSRDRARMLFADLFRALARPERPVVLLLDDVQWADREAIDLLGALASDASIRGLCLVVTVRDEALTAGRPIAELIDALRRDGAAPRVLSLAALDPGAIESLLGDALALPQDEARALGALVRRKTNGNALSAEVFLSAVHRDGLLAFDAAAGRWTWDAAAIEARPVADNVVELLAERTAALGEGARRALGVAACLGGWFDAAMVASVGGMTPADAAAGLDEAAREGLLVPAEGGFRFAHDRVLEAVYRGLSPAELRALHAAAYRALRAGIERPEESAALFEVLRHADAAGDVFDAEERLAIARLGLAAGRRARATAAFEAANAHLTRAAARLPASAWTSARAFAYELCSVAMECAYGAARVEEGDRLFAVLIERAPDDAARARAWGKRALAGISARRLAEGLAHVRESCALVGIRLPEKATVPVLLYELAKTSRVIKGRPAAELAALPRLSDARMEAGLYLLHVGMAAAYYIDRNLFVVLALRAVSIIARHGNTTASGDMYALYGFVLGAVLRDHRRMDELGQLALALCDRYPDPNTGTVAYMMNGVFIQHYRDHVRTSLPMLVEAQRRSLVAGSTDHAGVCSYFLTVTPYFAGAPLDDVLAVCEAQLRFTASVGGAEQHESLLLFRQILRSLQDGADGLGSLREHREIFERSGTLTSRMAERFWIGTLLTLLGRPREAIEELDDMPGDVDREWACLFQLGEHQLQRALALAALVAGGGLGVVERERHLLSLRLAVRKLADWAERAPHNFAHKHALASAELCGLTGDADTALRRYEAAIHGAQRGGFLQDAAIAQERAGRFFLQRKMVDVGTMYLASARRSYLRWGAHAKVALLDRELPGLADRDVEPREGATTRASVSGRTLSSGTLASVGSSSSDSGTLDAPSIVKATQALSGERTMGRLLSRMMEIVAESAGAQRGALLLVDGDPASPRIELHAEVTAGQPPVLLGEPRPLEVAAAPVSVVRWVARTGERVLLADASSEGPFTQDPYVLGRRSRSLLGMPLVWQGQVLGVLSLENELVPGAFTERRASLLATLCAQLAISIQNARYYAELERKVDERTRALRDAQSRIVALEKEATEQQMAGGFAHEMRNALAGARMLLRVALGSSHLPDGGLLEQASRRLAEIYVGAEPALTDDQRAALRERVRALNEVHRELDDVARRVDEAVARGLGITDDVLAYAALRREERGEVVVPLRGVAEAVARELSAPGVTIEIDVPEDTAVRCKPEHLRAILENVARNACEAVAEAALPAGGRVLLRASAGSAEVTLRVEDNGAGMPPEVQARMFEPFFSTKPTFGIGLGLGVVRKLVSLYEGRISVESAIGRGTVVTLVLPSGFAARSLPGREMTPRELQRRGSAPR